MAEPRYEVIALVTRKGVRRIPHLLDRTIPEPKLGGDRSQIVCDPLLFGGSEVIDFEHLDDMPDTAGDIGATTARWAVCQRCMRIAWDGLVKREIEEVVHG